MRMMVVYKKAYPLRHIGHLDLMRTMQRGLRRSGLPVRYSKGFNPHIKLSFAAPLSVGIAGEREIMDVQMDAKTEAAAFVQALDTAMPEALGICSARAIDDRFPTLMGLVAGNRYRIEPEAEAADFAGAIQQLLAMDEYMAVRKTKSGESLCNILPYIHSLAVRDSAIFFTAKNRQSGSLKPDVLMRALFVLANIKRCDYTVVREAILAKDANGNLAPLEGIQND